MIPIATNESELGTLEGVVYINSQITIQNEIFTNKTLHLVGITPDAKLEFDSGMFYGASQTTDIVFENLAIDSNIDIHSFRSIILKNCTIYKIAGSQGFYNCLNVYMDNCRVLTEDSIIDTEDGIISITNSYIETSDAVGPTHVIAPNRSSLSIVGCELVIHNFMLVTVGSISVEQTLSISNSRILIDHYEGLIFDNIHNSKSVIVGCSIDITSNDGNIQINGHKMIGNNIINRSADAAILRSAMAIGNTCINNGGGFQSTDFKFLNNPAANYNQI